MAERSEKKNGANPESQRVGKMKIYKIMNMKNEKSIGNKIIVNLSMFLVLIAINFLPIAIFLREGIKAALKLDFSALQDADNKMYITLILLNTVFAISIFTVSALKTSTTKFWAYMALADAAWWIYCMVG